MIVSRPIWVSLQFSQADSKLTVWSRITGLLGKELLNNQQYQGFRRNPPESADFGGSRNATDPR